MKISAKSRYALAALVRMGQAHGGNETITIVSLSGALNISRIYLEQVFSLLKRGGVVTSIKGAQGGYRLARPACEITAYDILAAVELALFEQTSLTVAEKAPDIEHAMQTILFQPFDIALQGALKDITLASLVAKANEFGDEGYMYYL